MAAVKSSEFQKNVGLWLDKVHEGPVRITKYDRPAAVLVSAAQYDELVSNFRKVTLAAQLTDIEATLIGEARVMTDKPFNLDDLPDVAEAHSPARA